MLGVMHVTALVQWYHEERDCPIRLPFAFSLFSDSGVVADSFPLGVTSFPLNLLSVARKVAITVHMTFERHRRSHFQIQPNYCDQTQGGSAVPTSFLSGRWRKGCFCNEMNCVVMWVSPFVKVRSALVIMPVPPAPVVSWYWLERKPVLR